MPFTLAIFQATVNASSGMTQVNAISNEDVTTIQNNNYFFSDNRQILLAYAQGATIDRARIVTSSYNQAFYPQIRPVAVVSTISARPQIASFHRAPLPLQANEFLQAQVVNGGSEATYVGMWVSSSLQPVSYSDIRCVRATGTTTLTANSLTSAALTWDSNLTPNSTYAIVGAECVVTDGVFFRLILSGQQDRPGGCCTSTVGVEGNRFFTHDYLLGTWGTFTNSQL